jgi:hypothetical protein
MIRRLTIVLATVLWSAGVGLAHAQTDSTFSTPPPPETSAPSPGAPSASASIANPATSVIAWFQGVSGNDPSVQEDPFELREAELGFQAAVDPFTRADFFLSASKDGLDVEEGYLTWLALPGGGQAKVGKFRADFGKFNRTHPPETPFADRPLAAQAFLGEEGLATTGLSLSALVPNPMSLYWDAIAQVGTVPKFPDESPLFESEARSDLLVIGRTSVFLPIHDSTDLNLGVSYANATAADSLRDVEGNRAQLGVVDVTMHWKNPRRSIYRSLLVQAEMIGERGSRDGAPTRNGTYAYVIYQFARQWKMGVRGDVTQSPGSDDRAKGALALLSWQPSEFSTLSIQARRVRDHDVDHDSAFFKWTFNIGPHGAHPY